MAAAGVRAGRAALAWPALEARVSAVRAAKADLVHGPTNSHATLRLFGKPEAAVRTVLYRDHHAWCPYCHKVWLWLEEKRVPYRIKKVTMFCYGEKEAWYTRTVPSGMLPAVEIDGKIVTESDDILLALEAQFGPLHRGMRSADVLPLRRLERVLFRAWCQWLCYPARSARDEAANREQFVKVAATVDAALGATAGPYFLDQFSTADCVFVSYVERMSASLFYYKGFTLRDAARFPRLAAWFDGMEARETYRGTQGDFHTHVHDLPPQMGGCYENGTAEQQTNKAAIDMAAAVDHAVPETGLPEPADSREWALSRVALHREHIVAANPGAAAGHAAAVDEALRAACTALVTGDAVQPPPGADTWLRYIRDRISVPRDMPVWSARRFREALDRTAALAGSAEGPAIPVRHRRDQDPRNFGKA